MRRLLLSLIVAACIAAAGQAAQPSSTALCDGVAAQIRSDRRITTGTWEQFILDSLTSGARPHIEVVDKPDFNQDADRSKFVSEFKTKFNPSDALSKVLAAYLETAMHPQVLSVPNSDLHALLDVQGSMYCEDYMFFRTPQTGPAQPVGDVPWIVPQDGKAFCVTGGELGRVDGIAAFLEQTVDTLANSFSLRIVPWRDDRWSAACIVDVQFKSLFEAWRLYVDRIGPSKAALAAAAPDLVRRRSGTAPGDVPRGDLATVQRMQALASDLDTVRVPTFGASAPELAPYYEETSRAKTYPLVLEGRTYLMLLGNASIGWRDFPETVLILYTLRDDKLTPVASAIIRPHRDGIESLRVTPSR